MIKSLKTIEGLAGTGKTTKIKEICSDLKHNQILYITFNREIMNEMKKYFSDWNSNSKIIIHTFHSLIYHELKSYNLIPSELKDFENNSNIKRKAFLKLEKLFINHFSYNNRFYIIDNIKTIFVDEFQNITSNLIKIINIICDRLDVNLYLVGDRYQGIFSYLEKNKDIDNFYYIKKNFNKDIDEIIILNNNYRSSNCIKSLINNYLIYNIKIEDKYLYTHKNTNELQEIWLFTNKNEEYEFIKQKCIQLKNKNDVSSVTILSRWKVNLDIYEKWIKMENLQWITLSTIHSFIGKESDVVFLVGFEKPESFEEKKILYTGLSRAKKQLILTTSYPYSDPSDIFFSNMIVHNHQKKLSKKYYLQLPVIKENKNFSFKKYNKCTIDSISAIVYSNEVPFYKIYNYQVGLSNNFKKSFIDNSKVPIKIDFIYTNKSYIFKLSDVNKLRKNGYSSKQVIIYMLNYITDFFNHQISYDNIYLYNIDLCKLFYIDDQFLKKFLEGNIRSKYKIYKVNENGKEIADSISYEDLKKYTIYYNFSNNKTKDYTLVIYQPINKNDSYHNKNLVKVEARFRKNSLKCKYAFGRKRISLIYLINELKRNKEYLEEVFYKSIEYRNNKKDKGGNL